MGHCIGCFYWINLDLTKVLRTREGIVVVSNFGS